MSVSHSDEGAPPGLACSESFWEVGQYKRTVHRIDDGLHLCHNLVAMVKERGEIEAAYAKQLNQWTKKWEEVVSKGKSWRIVMARNYNTNLTNKDSIQKYFFNISMSISDWE